MKDNPFSNQVPVQWCPGCPNFGILNAFKTALHEMGKKPHEVCLVSGIGQAAKLPHYLRCNFFNGLHGRAIPVATGIHAVNPRLTTIVVTGDGDCYGEGGNHFLHALRRNPDLTIVVHINEIYALTKGQAAPTTPMGQRTSLPDRETPYPPLNMLAVAISQNTGFVARGYAGNQKHLADLLRQAVMHPGLSLIEVIQPCITWGDKPLSWYKARVSAITDGYDASDQAAALRRVLDPAHAYDIGILYQAQRSPLFGEWFRRQHHDKPLYDAPMIGKQEMARMLKRYTPDMTGA